MLRKIQRYGWMPDLPDHRDDRSSRLIVRSFWGARGGKKGHFTMPYAYAADAGLARDFWTVKTVEE